MAIELGQPLWKAAADTIVSAIAGMRGDEDAAEQAAAEAERIAAPAGANCIVAMAQFGRVSAALGASRHDDAYAAAERLFDPADPAHHPAMASWVIGDLAEAALHVGRVDEARARVEQVEAAAGDNPTVWIALSCGTPAHRCETPVTRSTRLAALDSAHGRVASCAHQGSRAGGATPPPATS